MSTETEKNLKNLLPLIYIIPTYFLYICILYILFVSPARSKFSGSFYRLLGFSAVNDMIQSIFFCTILKYPFTPVFFGLVKDCPRTSWLYPILYGILYYCAAAQHFYSLFISFNRFTVFILLAKYKIFWKQYLKYFLAFAVLVPILFVWHFPFINVQCFFWPDVGSLIFPVDVAKIPWMDHSRNLFILILITSLLSFAMNMYVIFQLVKRPTQNSRTTTNNNITHNNTNTKISYQDKMMFIYSLLIFAIEICGCIQQSLLTFAYETFITVIAATQWILADVGTLAPVYFLLATNKQLRQEVFNLFDFGGNMVQNIPVISVSSSATQR